MDKLASFFKRHPDMAAMIAIFLITVIFFLPGIDFDPVPMDNSLYIGREYRLFPSWENIVYHLKTPILGLHSPLVMLSLMADYLLFGKDHLLLGGRLHNILLHALNAVMFYYLLRQLKLVRLDPQKPFTLSIPAVVFGALCFALHPQRVESVIWIVERKDVQALFLGLLSTIFFIRSYRKDRLPVIGALLYFLSFGAKPLVITLPGALLMGIWVCTEKFDWRKTLKMLSLYIAAAAGYIIFNFAQLHEFSAGAAAGSFDPVRLQIVILNYSNYFFRTLLPVGIQPLYPLFQWDNFNIAVVTLFSLLTVVTLILSLVKWRYQRIFTAFLLPLLLTYIGVVLPMAGFRVIGNAEFADRYSYYPSLVVWAGMAAAAEFCLERRFIFKFLFCAYGVLIAVLGICYLYTWQSRESFINAALGDGKNINPAALRMAAMSSFDSGEYQAARGFAYQATLVAGDDRSNRVFLLALDGMIGLSAGNPAGLEKIDQAITSPEWSYISRTFSEKVLLASAAVHTARKTEADDLFAAKIFDVLGNPVMSTDPLKEFSYRAIAALLRKDYDLAEKLTLQALRYAPEDAKLLHNLKQIRAAKNSPAKAASKQ